MLHPATMTRIASIQTAAQLHQRIVPFRAFPAIFFTGSCGL
jgi:hypothetical protein